MIQGNTRRRPRRGATGAWSLAALVILLTPAAPATAAGQAAPVLSSSLDLRLDGEPILTDSLPCPDCAPPKRFWAGAGELMIVQLIPWSVSRFMRDQEWAHISPATWMTNLKFTWQWDNNKFLNNQFSHPYHGSLYYNTGRANGYNFWQSAPWAFAGSLMWELFGEVWAPSPNDLLNTTLGGITLGEMLWRFSSLTLDNQATGGNRIIREVGAGLINPVREFNRLIRGETGQIAENPPDWRPSWLQGALDVGYRRFSSSTSLADESGLDQAYLQFKLGYGDRFADLWKAPFSSFQVIGALATEKNGRLTDLRVRGNLAGKPLGNGGNTMVGAFMTYEYISNPIVDFGGQGFQGGIVSRSAPTKPWRFYGEAVARAMPIAAIKSDYFVTAEGRDYDYGVAFGARLEGTAAYRNKGYGRVTGGYVWLPVISGFAGNHHLFTLTTEARGYWRGKYGLGVQYTRFVRRSRYTFNPDVDRDASEGRVFLSVAVPRWEE